MRRIKLAKGLYKISKLFPTKHAIDGGLTVQPFFVFGSGRNGSTLLNRILNQNSHLYIPAEQNFLGSLIIKYRLYNFLNWRDLMKIIVGELLLNDGTHHWGKIDSVLLDSLIHTHEHSLQHVIDKMYRSKSNAKKIWGDTTPQNTQYWREILDVFPQSKYIFIIRNGLDVVGSYKSGSQEAFGGLVDAELAAVHWQKSLRAYEGLRKKTDCLLVRYEELVLNPEHQIEKITEYLDIPYEKEMLNHHLSSLESPLHLEKQHANLKLPIFNTSINKGKSILSEVEFDQIRSSLKKDLESYGY